MSKKLFGIIREEKNPPDSRVALPPEHCQLLLERFGDQIDLVVQKSPNRCIKDEEYIAAGIRMVDSIDHCDVLIGVKEVPIDSLVDGKTYLFFSHTHKKQPYNRKLLRAMIEKRVRMIDYELLTYDNLKRAIGFGFFAGVVGAHNGMQAYGRKTGAFTLPAAHTCHDYAAMVEGYKNVSLPAMKIAVTGNGKVAKGALQIMRAFGIREVKAYDYCQNEYQEPVFVHLPNDQLYERRDGGGYDQEEFYADPALYSCPFSNLTRSTDLLINGIFWQHPAPAYFTLEDMQKSDFRIKVIADVTCDIAPEASIPSTLRATVIGDPVFGFDPQSGLEVEPYLSGTVDMMTIDNLPNELPRDASYSFGEVLIKDVFPELIKPERSSMIARANICRDGALCADFEYLSDFVAQEA